jgi:hypothetical protein
VVEYKNRAPRWFPLQQTIDVLARPFGLQLPAPLTDAELLWLSAHNEGIRFEQSADGELILSPPTGVR